MFSVEKNPAVRLVSYIAIAIAIALGLTALGTVIGTQQAHAAQLQAQSVKLTLPNGATLTVPDGTKISNGKATPTPSKLTTAQKQANKAWKKSGLEPYGKKYGWKCKKTWTKKSATKAVRKAHFYYNVGSKQKFMDIIQTTCKKSGKWTTTYRSGQDGKTYSVQGFKWTLKHSAPSNK